MPLKSTIITLFLFYFHLENAKSVSEILIKKLILHPFPNTSKFNFLVN